MNEQLVKEFIALLTKAHQPKTKAALHILLFAELSAANQALIQTFSEAPTYSQGDSFAVSLENTLPFGAKCAEPAEIKAAIQQSQCIFIPQITQESLTKGALCLADNAGLFALQYALQQQKPILAIQPDFYQQYENQNYQRMMRYYEEVLTRLGICFVPHSQIKAKLQACLTPSVETPKQTPTGLSGYVTYEDVVNQHEIHLQPDAKLTNLAKDYIREQQIPVSIMKKSEE